MTTPTIADLLATARELQAAEAALENAVTCSAYSARFALTNREPQSSYCRKQSDIFAARALTRIRTGCNLIVSQEKS